MDSLIQLKCLKEACRRRELVFEEYDDFGNLVGVFSGGRQYFFANYATPFNESAVDQVCKDKEFTHRIIGKVVKMPIAKGYFDPNYPREGYDRYKKFQSAEEISADIQSEFPLPVIVKMNSGSRGVNVFLCGNVQEIKNSIAKIFTPASPDYDYIALAEEFVTIEKEYRAVVFDRKILLLYRKDNSAGKYLGNLSPLHFSGSRAVPVGNPSLIEEFEKFLVPVYEKLPLRFAGFDIARDREGRLWLIEINSRPGFAIFIRDNGERAVVELYSKILGAL